jgi:cysteine desulfurase
MVAIMMANNEVGSLQPVQELAKVAKEQGALFFTDAVQAAPYIRLDVKELGVDMLAFSSHKFYGPKGCGVLYIKEGVKAESILFGGEQERGRRGGTTNVPNVVGMAAAYEKNFAEREKANCKIKELRELFLKEISSLQGVKINGAEGLPALLNLQIEGVENTALLYKMDLKGVCFAAGSACASASIKPSHVLTAMGLDERAAKECIRFSFGKENTKAQIDYAVDKIVQTVEQLVKKA